MTKIVVRLPEPKREYTEDNQRQINRAISSYRTVKFYLFTTRQRMIKKDLISSCHNGKRI
jgi:hypothetical protein